MRRLLALPLLLAAALSAPAHAATSLVTLKDIAISRPVVRIHVGDTVRWLFRDASAPHNVTSRGRPRFASSTSRSSGSYSVRFTRRGSYDYVCTIHPGMRGKVVVG